MAMALSNLGRSAIHKQKDAIKAEDLNKERPLNPYK
jgi:hypothetical protein